MIVSKDIIGISGELNAGKSIADRLLQQVVGKEFTVKKFSFSDPLYRALDKKSSLKTSETVYQTALEYDQKFGPQSLEDILFRRIGLSTVDVPVVDGIRRYPAIELLRSFPRHCLVYVTADPEIRYQRSLKRKQRDDEAHKTLQQFIDDDYKNRESLLPEIAKMADYRIVNNFDTEEGYSNEIAKFWEWYNQEWISDILPQTIIRGHSMLMSLQ